jgi:hypothetical protein
MDKRYAVTISLRVSECAGEDHKEMMNVDVDYHNLPYSGVVDIEQLMLAVLNKLGKWGVDKVEADAAKVAKVSKVTV